MMRIVGFAVAAAVNVCAVADLVPAENLGVSIVLWSASLYCAVRFSWKIKGMVDKLLTRMDAMERAIGNIPCSGRNASCPPEEAIRQNMRMHQEPAMDWDGGGQEAS